MYEHIFVLGVRANIRRDGRAGREGDRKVRAIGTGGVRNVLRTSVWHAVATRASVQRLVRAADAEGEGTRPAASPTHTTANDDDEGRGAMEAPNETVETKTGIETNTEAPMVT